VFLLSRRQVWVKIDKADGRQFNIHIAGKCSRDPAGLEKDMKRIRQKLQPGGES
jgi:hypothetical protein